MTARLTREAREPDCRPEAKVQGRGQERQTVSVEAVIRAA